jgi:hypothetical protein
LLLHRAEKLSTSVTCFHPGTFTGNPVTRHPGRAGFQICADTDSIRSLQVWPSKGAGEVNTCGRCRPRPDYGSDSIEEPAVVVQAKPLKPAPTSRKPRFSLRPPKSGFWQLFRTVISRSGAPKCGRHRRQTL